MTVPTLPSVDSAPASSPQTAPGEKFPGAGQVDPDSYVARFCARCDAELATLASDADRRTTLEGKARYWERALENFINAIDEDALDPPPNGPDVWQYHYIVSEIYARLARLPS